MRENSFSNLIETSLASSLLLLIIVALSLFLCSSLDTENHRGHSYGKEIT